MKKKTKESFIEESKFVHGDKYDYSKVEYVNARTKVCIICPEHGEFWQRPADHVRGIGCPKCKVDKITSARRLSTNEFIEKSKNIHGNKYDYSKVEYVNAKTKVCIICPEHGEFWQTPSHHLLGQGCIKCKLDRPSPNRLTTEEFISKAKQVHGDKYDYSKVNYLGNKTKVCIICPEHGEFWQTPNSHLGGEGCYKCRVKIYDKNSFIIEAEKNHGNKYDYSKVEYVNSITKVCIICPKHGEFWQTPSSHINQKCGCPICNQSHLEEETRMYMENNKIKFEQQKMFNWLGMMRLDFYLPELKQVIECQGIQHFEPTDFGRMGSEHARKVFTDIVRRDKLKKKLCEEHGLTVSYVNYNQDVLEQLKKIVR
jgi:very-short-patch-repair endonuclease